MRVHRSMSKFLLGAVVILPIVMAGCSSTTPTAVNGAQGSAAPITLAYITDLTGEGASENASSPAGFDARIDLQNSEGGVNGHKLVPLVIDDQTSPSEIATAVQEADSKAFGIVSQSPLFFLAAKYPQEAGVPVTGSYDDGPEWGEQPYTNMFAVRQRQRRPEVSGQHANREFPQGSWRHGVGCLWVLDLALFESRRHRHRPVVPTCRRQGRCPRHDRSLWRSGLHK